MTTPKGEAKELKSLRKRVADLEIALTGLLRAHRNGCFFPTRDPSPGAYGIAAVDRARKVLDLRPDDLRDDAILRGETATGSQEAGEG